MTNPYSNLEPKKFWRTAIADRNPLDVCDIWDPKFSISKSDKVCTFGSCFAQHIGRALEKNGYSWHITEQSPTGLPDPQKFGYDVFSARTGNIYTTSLLSQWTRWALNKDEIPNECWEQDGRYYDPFRPRVEPNGFASEKEMELSREQTVKSFRDAIVTSDIFVFTLGLTESWVNSKREFEYPMCPGTAAGDYDESEHTFINHDFSIVLENVEKAIALIRSANKKIRFILTVSPVPLTATFTSNHVMVATMESKSILRAVASTVSKKYDFVDYFPSYEVINSPVFKGFFFEPNQRNVNHSGVDFVMKNFFSCLNNKFGSTDQVPTIVGTSKIDHVDTSANQSHSEVCEEELLNAFAGGPK